MERWTWSHSLRNLGAKFSEMSFPHCKTYFTRIGHYLKTTIFKTLDSNYFTLSSMFSFQNAWSIKIYLFIYLVGIGLDHTLFSKGCRW